MKSFPLAICISLGFLGLVLNAIRRRALRDEMTVLWIAVAIAILVFSLTLPAHVLDRVAHALGVAYGSDLILVAAAVFLVILVFQLSISVGRLWLRTTRLTQDLAMLRDELQRATGTLPSKGRQSGASESGDKVNPMDPRMSGGQALDAGSRLPDMTGSATGAAVPSGGLSTSVLSHTPSESQSNS